MDEEPEEEAEEGAPAWMATFSDMATLLLTFFVLLLSFANMDVVEFRTLMGSVREAFGVQFETRGDFQARSDSPVSVAPGGSPSNPSILEHVPLLRRIQRELEESNLDGSVEAELVQRGVALRIRDGVLFESASATLLPEARPLLDQLGELAQGVATEVAIEGHTDDRPISTTRFPSNWELSAARATAVLRHLSASGAVGDIQLSIAGYADTRPVGDNSTAPGRALNRRVELILITPPDAEADDPTEVAEEASDGGDEAGDEASDEDSDESEEAEASSEDDGAEEGGDSDADDSDAEGTAEGETDASASESSGAAQADENPTEEPDDQDEDGGESR